MGRLINASNINELLAEVFEDIEGEAIQEIYVMFKGPWIDLTRCEFTDNGLPIPRLEEISDMKEKLVKYFEQRHGKNVDLKFEDDKEFEIVEIKQKPS